MSNSRLTPNGSAAARRSLPPSESRPTISSQTRCGGDRVVVLREGTGYGNTKTPLETKVAQVLRQLRRGEAHITFDPATESVNVVVTSATGGSGRPVVRACRDVKAAGDIDYCDRDRPAHYHAGARTDSPPRWRW
jgi:uncharacterized protein YheU (UPF0270 family)